MVQFDSDDLVSATELARNTSALVKQAAGGRRFVIINKNEPMAALIGMDDLKRLDALAIPAASADALAPPGPSSGPTSEHFLSAIRSCRHRFRPTAPGLVPGGISVPVGLDGDGHVIHVDIASHADGGMGPHGAIYGRTGSGKTNLAQVITWGLCALYSPHQIHIIIGADDRDDPAAWDALESQPHVLGVYRDPRDGTLDGVLRGELARRTEQVAQQDGDGKSNLPHLVLIIDEAHGNWRSTADRITTQLARCDQFLRIYVLLVLQRPSRGLHVGADRDFGYRIVMKMDSAQDSRAALGSADATTLPSAGSAILAFGDERLEFRTFLCDAQRLSAAAQLTTVAATEGW